MKNRYKITIFGILGFLGISIAVNPIFCQGFDVLPVNNPVIPCFTVLIIMPILTLLDFIF